MGMSPTLLTGLLDRHFGALVAWTGLRDGSGDDVVQEAFVRLAGQSSPPEHPIAWLYATTRHLASNERRAAGRRARRERLAAGSEHREGTAWATVEAAELATILLDIPDDLREVVVARMWGGLAFEEIAGLVGRSKATVWRDYGRALDLLRDRYGAATGGTTDDGQSRPTAR
jgi:RNA polymerase sigma factor (sigma-70 family)